MPVGMLQFCKKHALLHKTNSQFLEELEKNPAIVLTHNNVKQVSSGHDKNQLQI